MEAKKYLQQVNKLDTLIKNKLIEKEQWKSMALSTGSFSEGDRVQASGSKQKMEDAVCRYVEIEKEIDSYIDLLVDTKNEIVSTIELLDVLEYDLLHLIYIQGMTFKEVANLKGKTYNNVKNIHKRAVADVQKILDEREKKK